MVSVILNPKNLCLYIRYLPFRLAASNIFLRECSDNRRNSETNPLYFVLLIILKNKLSGNQCINGYFV